MPRPLGCADGMPSREQGRGRGNARARCLQCRAFASSLRARASDRTHMNSSPEVFKAYDIRGIVGQTIDEAFAEHLGRAFGTEALAAGERAVAIGRDGRHSGPAFCAALARGLAATGLDVVD